jgi:hypothetical protein
MMADNGKPGLRVRILPPKQAAAATAQKPTSPSGNGVSAAAPPPPAPAIDLDLEPDPVRPIADDLNDEIPEEF